MVHKCDRDTCEPKNVSGPKEKCAKCGNLCFLRCFGIDKCENVNEKFETVQVKLGENAVMYAILPCTLFVCCEPLSLDDLSGKLNIPSGESKAVRASRLTDKMTTPSGPSKPIQRKITEKVSTLSGASKSRQTKLTDVGFAEAKSDMDGSILSKLNILTGMISELTSKANDIHEDTQFLANKSIARTDSTQKKIVPRNISLTNASKSSFFHTPAKSFADALRSGAQSHSAKRPRIENSPKITPKIIPKNKTSKFEAPQPKMGTKSASHRLSVVVKPKRIEKPVFKKAIWISGFKPMTTPEEIIDYIVNETSVNEQSKFNVHKLVKKDKDVTTLKFVSFKIELNEDDFDILINPEVWEEDVLVREFLQNKTLGDFFPALNPKNISKPPETDLMDFTGSTTNITGKSPNGLAQTSSTTKSPSPKEK